MSDEVKDQITPKPTRSAKKDSTVTLVNRLNEDVFIGEGLDAILIPPRGQIQLPSSQVPQELPRGVFSNS